MIFLLSHLPLVTLPSLPLEAPALDNLSGKFLKDGAAVLAKLVSQIFNLSIKYSIFPLDCNKVKLKPLFKIDSKTAPKNYRPTSLHPLVFKIIKKAIHDHVTFLDKNNIIYRYQSGFRKLFSIDSFPSYLNINKVTSVESGL